MLIINAIPGRIYEAEACGMTTRATIQFVQQMRNSYSWGQRELQCEWRMMLRLSPKIGYIGGFVLRVVLEVY